MKVAFFVDYFPEVSETFILNQIVSLLDRGHEVDIDARGPVEVIGKGHADVERYQVLKRIRYCTPTPKPWLARLQSAGARIIRWGWRSPATTLESLNVKRYGKSALNLTLIYEWLPAKCVTRDYDVIHCHFGPNGQRAIALRNFGALRGPIITTFHGYDANLLPRIHGPKLYATLFKRGESFTVGSEFMRQRIISLGAPEGRIDKLPMGVRLSRFICAERIAPADGEFRLLTVSRLVEVKGIEHAIRAVAVLKDRVPRLRYQIVGDGPLRNYLEALSTCLGLRNTVEFLGTVYQDEVGVLYQHAHAFLLASVLTETGEEENQPVVLAEAQACGLPVIATAIGGIAECVRDGHSGFLVPPGNPEAIASRIYWLASHSEAWVRMGRAGRELVERQFNLEILTDQLVDLYRDVSQRFRTR